MSRKLSILIPTLPDRIGFYSGLMSKLKSQREVFGLQDKVQILSLSDTKEMSVGDKRNWLFDISCGEYIQYLDDDDRVSDNYLLRMYEGTLSGADCVTFKGEYHEDGAFHSDFIISTMVKVDTNQHGMMYRRPNHICAVRRDIVAQCRFPSKNYGEDSEYSEQINKLITNEHHIPEKLYFYIFNKSTSQTIEHR